MAGIGFHLDRVMSRDTFYTDVATAAGAGFVFSGPWIFGTVANIVLYLHAEGRLTTQDQEVMFSMLTYSYAGAMILTSFLTFPVTRYLADKIYIGHLEAIGPTFVSAWILHMIAAATISELFYAANALPGPVQFLGVLIAVATTQIWLAGAFINMLRSYVPVAVSFLVGYALAAGAGVVLGSRLGLVGYLAGFWLGLAVVALTLTSHILLKFSFPQSMDFGFLGTVRAHRYLLLVGFTLAAGVWADKIVFWILSPYSLHAAPYLRTYPVYDVAFTIGCLASLPGTAWIMLGVETTFAKSARHIFTSLSNHEPYASIQRGKLEVAASIRSIFWGLLKVEAVVCLPLLVYTDVLADALGLPAHMIHVIRFSILAAAAALLQQAQTLYLMYFDLPGVALVSTSTFLVGNIALSLLSMRLGYGYYGLGYLLASYLAVLVGGWTINRALPDLEYRVLAPSAAASIARS